MNDETASAAFTDMPYNLRIDGHVSGKGRTVHREFAMANPTKPADMTIDFDVVGWVAKNELRFRASQEPLVGGLVTGISAQ